jgi:hypothetical protein
MLFSEEVKKATKTLASMIEEEQLRLKAKQLDLQAFKETCNRSVPVSYYPTCVLDIELVVSRHLGSVTRFLVILFNTHPKS